METPIRRLNAALADAVNACDDAIDNPGVVTEAGVEELAAILKAIEAVRARLTAFE